MAVVADIMEADKLPHSNEMVKGGMGEYQLGEVLGDGGYGIVFKCQQQSGRKLAIKVEKYSKSMLFMEAAVLRMANARFLAHFCLLVDFGSHNKEYTFVVMSLLDKDLHRLRSEQPDRRFSLSTAIRACMQALDAIHELHTIQFISRDIKPGNFAPGHRSNRQHKIIYMFDFGLARRTVDRFNVQIPSRGEVGWRGTTRYGSLNAHDRVDLSFRDDIESWFYMLVELTRSCLPWRLVTDRDTVRQEKKKLRNSAKSIMVDCPPTYANILSHIDSLNFGDKPNYHLCMQILDTVAKEKSINMDDSWDWEDDVTSSLVSDKGTHGSFESAENCKVHGSIE